MGRKKFWFGNSPEGSGEGSGSLKGSIYLKKISSICKAVDKYGKEFETDCFEKLPAICTSIIPCENRTDIMFNETDVLTDFTGIFVSF